MINVTTGLNFDLWGECQAFNTSLFGSAWRDEAFTSYYAACAGLSYYMKKVKTILPDGTVQITYVQIPITYGGSKSALLSTANGVTAVNTAVNNAKGTRTAAVNTALNAAKTANAAVRKTKDAEVGKLYTKVENTAWNTYYVATLTAEKVYTVAYTTAENTFKTSKTGADNAYLATVIPAAVAYEKELCRLQGLFQDAVGQANLGYGINSNFYAFGATSTNVQVCFAAGEQVHLPENRQKNVEDIEVNDMVMAVPHDDPHGKARPCRVVRVFKNAPQRVWQVKIKDTITNEIQTIRVTGEHPFFVAEKGWIAVKDLQTGDTFRTIKGDFTQVFVNKELEIEAVPVYNFEVENAHTYFVGKSDTNAVLVHNDCPYCGQPGPWIHYCWSEAWDRFKSDMYSGAYIAGAAFYGAGEAAGNYISGAGSTIKQAGLYVVDVAVVSQDALNTGIVAVAGYYDLPQYRQQHYLWFNQPWTGYQEMSGVGQSNKPSDPDFWWNAFDTAGHAGLSGGTLGTFDMGLNVYNYSQDGDAAAFSRRMGEIGGGQWLGVGIAKLPGANPRFEFNPTPGSGANPVYTIPRLRTAPHTPPATNIVQNVNKTTGTSFQAAIDNAAAKYSPNAVGSGNDIMNWLGPNSRKIVNETGDLIFQSENGLREIRFDFKNFQPHDKPHIHLLEYKMKKNNKVPVKDIRTFFDL